MRDPLQRQQLARAVTVAWTPVLAARVRRRLDETIDRLGGMVSRLSIAIVAAALIMGLPILATSYEPPLWSIMAPVWFFSGTLLAVGLVLRLVWLGRRKGRH